MARTKRQSGAGAVGIAGRTAAPRADRKFPWTVSAGIIQGWIVNLLLAVVCFTGVLRGASAEVAADASGWQKLQAWFAALPVWLLPTLGLLFVLGAFLLWVVYSWQQWGVVGLFFVPLAQAFALHNAGVGPLIVTVFALAAIAPVIALTVLLCSGRPTLWSRMD
jgi:hypothetical protein